MKTCRICGCYSEDHVATCPYCGVHFPAPVPLSSPAEPIPEIPPKDPEVVKQNRMRVAGFVLSLMGAQMWFCTPLQVLALLLSVFTPKADSCKGLRTAAIIISSITVFFSLCIWILFIVFFDFIAEDLSAGMMMYY